MSKSFAIFKVNQKTMGVGEVTKREVDWQKQQRE